MQKPEHPLYRYLDEAEILLVNQALQQHTFAPGQRIINAGDRNRDLICLDKGRVSVQIENADAEAIEIASLEQGSLIGEMNFILPTHRTANVIAASEVAVSIFAYHELSGILAQNHALAIKIFAALNLQLSHKYLQMMRQS